MNDNQTPCFADSRTVDEPVIIAEIVAIRPLTEDTETDWFNLSRQLHQHNQELVATIVPLEKALFAAKEQLKTQNCRLRICDTLLAQQTEELNRERQQSHRSSEEIENYRQSEQRQQALIAHLSEELTTAQRRLAHLERECTLVQEDYHEKTQKLLTAEKQIRELRSRLHRQQRYTLQYKTALDECLGVRDERGDLSILPKVSSIEPWSNSEEMDEELQVTEIVSDFAENGDSIEEFVAELEFKSPDWPSPIISPGTSFDKHPFFRVNLPTFLKNRPDNP